MWVDAVTPGGCGAIHSEEMLESSLDSAASFNRSALLMYLGLLFGASLALAFFA